MNTSKKLIQALEMLETKRDKNPPKVDSEWRKNIGSIYDSDLRQAARNLLTLQDGKLEEIYQKAASNGLNVTLQVRSLEDPADQPYSA